MKSPARPSDALGYLVCRALAENDRDRVAPIAAERYARSGIERIAKAAVPGLESEDFQTEFAGVVQAAWPLVREQLVFDRLPGVRRQGFLTRNLRSVSGPVATWVGDRRPIPVARCVFDGELIAPRKIAAIEVRSIDAQRAGGPEADKQLQDDLFTSLGEAASAAFVDVNNAGDAETPAAITYGAGIAASESPVDDLQKLVEGFGGNLQSAAFIMDPILASQLALFGSQFPNLGINGGELLGLPALTTVGSPRDTSGGQLALIDGSSVGLAMDSFTLEETQQAMISMSDMPGSESVFVNLFQAEAMAIKALFRVNWRLMRPGAALALTGCNYTQT
ncbi:MAG TPA: hypothetical protein VGC79_08320 [Polyangiaceae bacterium]